MSKFTRRGFIKLSTGGLIATTLGYRLAQGAETTDDANLNQRLASVGGKFRFAILADPHIQHPGDLNRVPVDAERNLKQAVAEINGAASPVDFVVHIGDLGNVPDIQSLDHWLECIQPLKPLSLLVHGNHDGKPPYEKFRDYENRVNHQSEVFYSFDCGGWHFAVIPCNLNGRTPEVKAMTDSMLAFLEKDLDQNSAKPTIVLQHLHFMTMGLTQTEWYFFELELRKKLLALYTKHGNVKWAFNGHVHNGLLASVRTSWNYKGINFVNCPTIIEGRPFGEEVPGFESGLKGGGYYLIVEVDGEDIRMKGHLAGVSQTFDYPQNLQVFTDDIEPKLFHKVGELPVSPVLVNGTFTHGLDGWSFPHRYMRAVDPVYSAGIIKRDDMSGENALHIKTREAGVPLWAKDEYYEAAQICALESGKSPVFSASYKVPEEPASGGGYVRLELLRDLDFIALLMFHWGNHEEQCVFTPLSVGYALTGLVPIWTYFPQLVNQKKGFFWTIPMTPGWHNLKADIATLLDQAAPPGAFARLAPNKVRIALGTWNDKIVGTSSEALFGGIQLAHENSPQPSMIDGQALAGANLDGVRFGMSMEKTY